MKGNDRAVLIGIGVFVLLAAFWMLLLAPKRGQVADLNTEIADLNRQIDQQRATAEFGKQARAQFPAAYSRLVVLGKAVPTDGDQASLLVELNRIATVNGVDFRSVALSTDVSTTATPAAAAPATGATGATGSTGATGETGSTGATGAPSSGAATPEAGTAAADPGAEPATVPAPTESTAAMLPIGATIGPAGLGVLPYDLTFQGNFFQIGKFVNQLEELTRTRGARRVIVNGRLTTIDGFSLSGDTIKGFPLLDASFTITTFLAPPGQGLLGGATPSGPGAGPAAPAGTAPATTTSTSAPAATVSP